MPKGELQCVKYTVSTKFSFGSTLVHVVFYPYTLILTLTGASVDVIAIISLRQEIIYLVDVVWWNLQFHPELVLTFLKDSEFYSKF